MRGLAPLPRRYPCALEIAGAVVYPAAMLQKFILALAIGAGCAGVAMAEPRSGIDISAIDPGVRPQDMTASLAAFATQVVPRVKAAVGLQA